MSHSIVFTKQCITSLVHTGKITKEIVAPAILGKSPNCFNKLLWEWYSLKNHSATLLQRFRDIVHADTFDCISAHYPSVFPSQSRIDSYPWYRQATWEWARQHWRCNYLNVLKHFLHMVDVSVVRQIGRVEEVVAKYRLLDVHIPPWRADFMHICWRRASISAVLACRAPLSSTTAFHRAWSWRRECLFPTLSLVDDLPNSITFRWTSATQVPVSVCFHPSETAFHRETSCLSTGRREQDGDVQQNPNGVLHGCCLFRLLRLSLDRLSTKSAKCAHSSSGTSLSVRSNDFQHSDRVCSVCGEGRGARCCLALLWEERPLFGDALADRLRDSGTQGTHIGLSGWWHSAIAMSEGSTERFSFLRTLASGRRTGNNLWGRFTWKDDCQSGTAPFVIRWRRCWRVLRDDWQAWLRWRRRRCRKTRWK